MALALYLAFIGAACALTLVDWRRGCLLVIVCGVLQDPVRKLTGGTPVWISFAVVALYATILFSARHAIATHLNDFGRRFSKIYTAIMVFILLLFISAFNGMITYGFDKWKAPAVSLFTYVVPLVAIGLGYAWLQREELMDRYFRLYAAVTAVALIGTTLEYLRVQSRLLGMVAFEGDYIRHLPGIQIRLLSGIYRSPDIMAWHAAMLTSIAIALALRAGFGRSMLLWGSVATWGFFNCMIAGRRKAIYFVVVFAATFLWRYMRRIQNKQVFALFAVLLLLAGVVRYFASGQETSIYARGAIASRAEVAQRLEGGAIETFRQVGLMGAGLGSATQGVHHLLGAQNLGWQEGGLGKLAVEVGLPGLLAMAVIAWMVARLLLRLTAIGDVPGSSQFLRAMLFGLAVANATGFMASAQAYSDAILALTSGFLFGCLFATAALDERLPKAAPKAIPAAAGSHAAPVLSPG
jgi:hypothetical protein